MTSQLIELGAIILGLGLLGAVSVRFSISPIPLYLLAGLAHRMDMQDDQVALGDHSLDLVVGVGELLLQERHQRVSGARMAVPLDRRTMDFVGRRKRIDAAVLVREALQQRGEIVDVLHDDMDHA